MKNKQTLGLVIAGLVFVLVSASGIYANQYLKNNSKNGANTFLSAISNSDGYISLPLDHFVGVVCVEGTILGSDSSSSSLLAKNTYNHNQNMKFIDKMMDASNNKGILLYVDSPGGTVYHSDELYLKLMEYKQQTERPVWAFCAGEACSGGYYISMASDKIYANRNCWLGSIGVIIQLTNMKELYDKIGIKEVNITSGKNKAMGSGGIDMTQEQRDILQELVDESYDQFVDIVADGRMLSNEEVRKLADGRIYSAKQCLDNGLIDYIGDYETTKKDFKTLIGAGDITFYQPQSNKQSVFSSFFNIYQETKPKSDAQIITEYLEKKGNGVLMYYAE